MKIFLSKSYQRNLKKLTQRDNALLQTIKDKLKLFQENPNHPSLRLHKLSGRQSNQWSFRVKDDLRILFTYVEDGVLLTDIGTHDEVY